MLPQTPRVVANPADKSDPWALADSPDYDPAKFYTAYHGKRGDFAQVNVKISKALHAQLQALCSNPRIGWKTVNDAVRDALTHRVKYIIGELEESQPALERVIDTSMIEDTLHRQETEEEERQELLNHLRQRMNMLSGRNELGQLRELLDEADVLADVWSDFQHGIELTALVKTFDHVRRRQQMRSVD